MKTLLTLLLILFTITAQADSGFFYDKTRSGEGIIVSETASGGIAWVLFAFTDKSYPIKPIVSPSPPEPLVNLCASSPLWLTGASSVLADGFAIGTVYMSEAPDYPVVTGRNISQPLEVGTFLIERNSEGFDLILETNNVMPYLSIFQTRFTFTDPLAR